MQCSVIHKSEVWKHKDMRLDAEFYKPDFIENENVIKVFSVHFSECLLSISGGATPLGADYFDSGIPFLRVQNIMQNYINGNDVVFISEEENRKIKRSTLSVDDVLLTITGVSYGKSATVTEDYAGANINQHSVRLRFKKDTNPHYVSTFLNCRYGKKQSDKNIVGVSRPALDYYAIRNFLLPVFSLKFQNFIGDTVNETNCSLKESHKKYNEAESILLSELGLTNWQPKHQLYFIKNYSDTKRSGRIDAEYYQPKYEEIINAIKTYSGGWDTLDNVVIIKKCIEIGSGEYLDEGIPFVRVSNISSFEITKEKHLSESLYNELTLKEENIPFEITKNHQPKKGEILFSKDGTPGIAHYLKEQPQKMIPSGGILRLKSKTDKVNNEYLTLVLNSMLVQEQVNRDVGGSIILHWRPDQVKETIIPILPTEKQTKIQQKVTESFALRKQSKHLLECAKKAVEMAIEQDEQTAIKWLKKQTNEQITNEN